MGRIAKLIFGISPKAASFARRRLKQTNPETSAQLEQISIVFLQAYNISLEEDDFDTIVERLHAVVGPEHRVFAYEGVGMALTSLDYLTPWRRQSRLQSFLEGPGRPYIHMIHTGVGLALARLHRLGRRPLRPLHAIFRWLVFDGCGFHDGLFHWKRYGLGRAEPKYLSGYERRAFDQGLGRCIWFMDGTDINQIPATIAAFAPERQSHLWGGIGSACAFVGGIKSAAIKTLQAAAGDYQAQLAQGAAFAAKARQLGQNPAAYTTLACEIFCGTSAKSAAAVVDRAGENLPPDGQEPQYEIWRQRVQAHFAKVGLGFFDF